MRLIDADALRKEVHCAYSDDLGICEMIDNQQTAYDVEKVVQQIETHIKYYDDYESICLERGNKEEAHTFSCFSTGLCQALDFVRNGGKE